ncbi:MAG: tyrosine-type recombinase/integrase [Bacilli bacterium]|nr:tyrosine-type recombinase/integrase [Bacilli bacterium]
MKEILGYLNYLKVVKKYSDCTILGYKEDLLELYDFKNDVLKYSEEEVRDYLEYLYSRGLSRNTISRKLSSIRSFYRYMEDEGKIFQNYFKEVSNPRKKSLLPKYARDSDLEKMFHAFSLDDVLGQRNALVLEMLYATGVRVSELVNICVGDINLYDKTIHILGKGRKERVVFFGSYCEDVLRKYLNDGYLKLNQKQSKYLFLNKNGEKLSSRYVRKIIDMAVLKCGVDYHISPHTLRHTFATDMLNNGADLMTVKELLGHSSVNTTGIYTHVSNERLRNVYEFAHPRGKE